MATREEVYAKFGLTAEAAQLFETELGTILLAREGEERGGTYRQIRRKLPSSTRS